MCLVYPNTVDLNSTRQLNVDFQTKKTRDSDYRLTALSVSAEVRALATPAATGVRCGQIGLSVNYNDHA